MELKEFIEKVDQILRFNFGYTYKFEPANPSYNYNSNGDSYNWTFDFDPNNNKGVCPSALSIVVYTGTSRVPNQEKGKIGLFYTSVLYHITPTGNHSLTTKSFDTTSNLKKIEKFKFDNLYKWAECQKSIYNNYTQILKMKDIDKRLKELNKDFENENT